ncbi:heparinase II/III family protein [Zavarzinia compransoris]|uniref:heparinase II/III family protein n=1 Tax=Zavarzinia marina TaxID=2911065 RepID=UPI001F3CC840|nr:heparinase II/III family protein [Zavarzinia marina]MCF4165302.1 heparinase II/III family protein [Zavarzinia marina]
MAAPDPRLDASGPTTLATLPGLPPAWTKRSLARARLAAIGRELRATAAASRLSVATLGRAPSVYALNVQADPFPGSIDEANALFQGRYHFAGETLLSINQTPWTLIGASPEWREALHDFHWLRHFETAGGDAAQRQARALLDGWLRRYGRFDARWWRPDLAGRRLMAWTGHLGLLLDDADPALREGLLEALMRQKRYIARAFNSLPPGLPRVQAAVGLAHGCLALGQWGRPLARALRRLDGALAGLILPDGGYPSRDPADHLALLEVLVRMRGVLAAAGQVPGDLLTQAIDRLAPAVRFFRLGDGRLAAFHGGQPGAAFHIDRVLALAAPKGKAPARMPHAGYERLETRRLMLVLDVGAPPPPGYCAHAHVAPLAFEMSSGRDRLIVSCGAALGLGDDWRRVARATAAHSTMTLDDQNAWISAEDRDLGFRPVLPAMATTANRKEADGQVWIEASHSGYGTRLGLIHRRSLWLDAEGIELRGEDRVEPRGRAPGRSLPFTLRFHLAPDVRANLTGDGSSVLLRTHGGDGWRFRALGGQVGIEESISVTDFGPARRAEQIVVSGSLDAGRVVLRWALRRLDGKH